MRTTMPYGAVIIPVFGLGGRERTPGEAAAMARETVFDEHEPLRVERSLDRYLVSRDEAPLSAARPARRR
jgi:hypothetical protein